MKALVEYHDSYYLVETNEDGGIDPRLIFELVNKHRWPDECQPLEWIQRDHRVVAYFTDESRLCER